MTTQDCINILKKVRNRSLSATPAQLLDYIDGQIDALSTVGITPDTVQHDIPRSPLLDGCATDPTESGEHAPRFRGADMQ